MLLSQFCGSKSPDHSRETFDDLNVPFLGELPLVQGIREAGDVGRPAVLQDDTPAAQAIHEIISNFAR